MGRLDGKVAIITGGNSGIGAVSAVQFAKEGAKVVISARRVEQLNEVADKIKAAVGWEPDTMFKDGIKLTIKWYFENADWMKNVTSGDYQKYYADMYAGK